jgi:glucosamine-6-phosphate deaminase
MRITCFDDGRRLAQAAADQAAAILTAAIARRGRARIVAATGASQFAFLAQLTRDTGIDWPLVEMFHLDEYIGLPADHPASFRRFLIERLITPTGLTQHHLLDGEADPRDVCRQMGCALRAAPVDVAFIGIGENGHLAFNDPPADFETTEPYLVVALDEACRRQQVGEGWFETLADVPRLAISMSIRQILSANALICIVPDARKAPAVRAAFEGEITPQVPASILRTHPDVTVYLDRESAALLDERTFQQWS